MLLKSLELQGFKTFPDKTKLTFEDGISAVVGPNGSGKSNISDAMRWVLGEQSAKSLRCVRMEDVIFSGTAGRKAQGFAEVTLTIDNQSRRLPYDGDTVAITRRYYRSGDSEYLINKATVRLKDIHELFMDTGLGRDGYSMIGQGKIDAIISAKSEERREIFEEAAGISRFRYRKEESERKLQKAEENLLRLQDILQELEGRVGPLKEQSEKAKTYLALYEEKRSLEIGLWLYALNQSGQILREQEEKITIARNQHAEADAAAAALDAEIEALFRRTNACLAEAERIRAESAQAESEAVAKDGTVSVLENDRFHLAESIRRLTEEQSDSQENRAELQRQLEEKQAQSADCETVIEEKHAACDTVQSKLEQLRRSMDVSADQLEIANDQLRRLEEETAGAQLAAMQASSTAEEIDLRMTAIGESIREKQALQQTLEDQCQQQRQILQDAESEEDAKRRALEQSEATLHSGTAENDRLKHERDQAYLDLQESTRRIRILEDLERSMEGFANSVKTVMRMKEKGELSGIHGPVSRLLTVPQEYAVAIETALGSSAQHIVVGTEGDAKQAIGLLKRKDGGRATFLPMTTIRGKVLQEPELSRCAGFIGIAGALCQCDAQYRNIRDSLLGRIAVAETLDHAVEIAKRFRYAFRVVTLDGQVVNAGGSMTGGSLLRKNGLLSRAAEITTLKEKAVRLTAIHQQRSDAFAENTAAMEQLRKDLQTMRETLAETAAQRLELAGTLHRLQSECSSCKLQIQELRNEQTYTAQRRKDLTAAQEQAERQIRQLSEESLRVQAELGKISGGRSELEGQQQTLAAQLQELRFQQLTAEKDRELLQSAIADLKLRLTESEARLQAIQQELDENRQRDLELEAEAESARAAAASLRETAMAQKQQAEALQQERLQLEQRSVALRAKEKEHAAVRETIGQELTRLEERKLNLQQRYDTIIEQLWNEYELTRREAEAVAQPIENEAESSKRLRTLKNKIKALGSVNVAAIEEYKEVSERYAFLTEQVADVEKSRTELLKLIRELTKQMTEIFEVRFQEINQYFQTTFTELFGGGKAHLELEEPEDVLHSGIRIMAQPPGKIVKNLELLSGGEKALVAVSLYFSIMKVTPPPFCMLDEIEAALDDVNVTRFAEYLRRMNEKTQFIVITHRRGTMEEADVLYGVTMQDEGVSKLLKLDPAEVGNRLGMAVK